MRTCLDCGADLTGTDRRRKRCLLCAPKAEAEQKRAWAKLHPRLRTGLPVGRRPSVSRDEQARKRRLSVNNWRQTPKGLATVKREQEARKARRLGRDAYYEVFARPELPDDRGWACWTWLGVPSANPERWSPEPRVGKRDLARIYKRLIGPVPKWGHLHHEFRNTLCVNPLHIKILTGAEHAALHGQELSEALSWVRTRATSSDQLEKERLARADSWQQEERDTTQEVENNQA
jgi:hypothetical protein